MWRLYRDADLSLDRSVRWNVLPRWNGTTKATAAEIREGLGRSGDFLPLISGLITAILVGGLADRAIR